MLSRMTESDREGFAGASDLPSGAPLIGECDFLAADGTNAREYVGVVTVSCDDDGGFRVEVHLIGSDMPGGFPDNEDTASWTFNCERDAVAFAEFVCSGRLSFNAVEKIAASAR